jgi:hypothetical protein
MNLKIGRRTSIALRIFLYAGCFILGIYVACTQDSWTAQEGTAQYERYLWGFKAIWVDIWGTLTTAVLTFICWIGCRVTEEQSPFWNCALIICRRSFACFGFVVLGCLMVSLPPVSSSGSGLFLFLACLYLLSKRDN